jgi:hypothetical protein
MANLSADASIRILGEAYTTKCVMDTSSAQTIYKGGPVIVDHSVDSLLVATAASVTMTTDDSTIGIAAEQKTVAASAAENTLIEIYTWPTIVGFKSTVFDTGDTGKHVWMSDTGTLAATVGTYPEIGILYSVQDGYAFVRLETPIHAIVS